MKANTNQSNKPTPDDLAGEPLCKEEESGKGLSRTHRDRCEHGLPAAEVPGADDLAGIPISIEGNEDLSIRPRKARRPAP